MRDSEVHVQRSVKDSIASLKDSVFGGSDNRGLSLKDVGEQSGVKDRLYSLAHNQEKLQTKVEELATKIEGSLFEKVGDAGAGEGIKMGMTEAGKQSGLPLGEVMGSLSGAALQAIYNNREKVKEILGLKSDGSSHAKNETSSVDSVKERVTS